MPGRATPATAACSRSRRRRGAAPACSEAGILGAVAGVVGTLMAVEALKELVGIGGSLSGRLLLYDALSASTRTIRFRPRAGCPACGG